MRCFRLTYRAYLVLNKPLDELVGLLGFEVPTGPQVDLAGVKADGLVLHWKPRDDRKTTHRYDIQVNGAIVGEVSHADTSIVIANLCPEKLYIVRVITVNSVDFRAASEPIRVYTKSSASGDFYHASSASLDDYEGPTGPPTVSPVKRVQDSSAPPPTPPPMIRESSSGPGQPKRSLIGRRPSPAVLGIDTQNLGYENDHEEDAAESQHALTEKLDEIGRETTDIDRQIQEDDHEAGLAKVALVKERDELRADLREKEETSRDLRKQVNTLERNNQTAQNKKNAQEKALQQKLSERQKLKDDAVRWEAEITEMKAEITSMHAQKASFLAEAETEKAALQEKQNQELHTLKTIEDENREVGLQIKQLEREATNSPSNAEPNEYNDALAVQELEEDRYWHERLRSIEEQYVAAAQAMENARRLCFEATGNLAMAKQRHADMAHVASAVPIFDQPISRANSQRHNRRQLGAPATTSQSSASPFPVTTTPTFTNGITSISPTFTTTASPFFNINNGMTLDRPMNGVHFEDADVEKLTGGAPMSPGAGADLLPADLLSNADEEPRGFLGPAAPIKSRQNSDGDSEGRQHSTAQMLPGLGALPGLGVLPGLGASNQANGPASPGSIRSHSPILFASPGASASNLVFNSPENALDSDRRSVRSSRSNRAASGSMMHSGSRFTQILGLDKLNRQRGKTLSDDGPALGSLTKSQSQSMPRGADEPPEEESSLGRRRNSSHSGNFFGGMLTRNSAHSKSTGEDSMPTQKHIATRRRPFNMFGSKTDGWAAILGADNRPSSPRPGSTHSTELPRPSGDSTNWGFWPSAVEPFGQRSSPLSADWVSSRPEMTPSNLPWGGSRVASRRPSVQQGPSSGIPDFILEDDDHSDDDENYMPLPPIGTKPAQMPPRVPSPKLNPAAKDFKSLFSRSEKKARKDDADKKENDVTTPLASRSEQMPFGSPEMDYDHSSPALSRRSRDNRSIATADSSMNEFSTRNSLDRSVSFTPSEMQTPASLASTAGSNKESFMAKLTRKSSSGKFSLPVFSREKKARPTREERIMDEEDDALTSSLDSISREDGQGKKSDRGGSVRSWSSMFTGSIRKGKDRADKTPSRASLSEASAASETGDDDEDDEDGGR